MVHLSRYLSFLIILISFFAQAKAEISGYSDDAAHDLYRISRTAFDTYTAQQELKKAAAMATYTTEKNRLLAEKATCNENLDKQEAEKNLNEAKLKSSKKMVIDAHFVRDGAGILTLLSLMSGAIIKITDTTASRDLGISGTTAPILYVSGILATVVLFCFSKERKEQNHQLHLQQFLYQLESDITRIKSDIFKLETALNDLEKTKPH